MENEPNLKPTTWETAACLMAYRIDDARDQGLQHPEVEHRFLGLLTTMRNEYDSFCYKAYGVIEEDLDAQIVANWFTAFATLALDAGESHEDIHVTSAIDIVPFIAMKQHDYGHMNIQRFGLDGILVRLHDKLARLENLETKHYDASTDALCEAKEDTIVDIIGYSIIACMYAYGMWMLPLSPMPEDWETEDL